MSALTEIANPTAVTVLVGSAVVVVGGIAAGLRRGLRWGLIVQVVGMTAVGVGGATLVLGAPSAGSGFSGSAGVAFGLDPLTGFFLLALGACSVPALVFAVGYVPGTRGARVGGPLTAGFLLSLVAVLTARSVATFLTFWELMTLVPAAMILAARQEPRARRAVFEYLAITHLGGAGVWIALLMLLSRGVFGDPAALQAAGGTAQAVIAIAAIIGFGTKAGIMPFHSWLPRAHPLAPSHVSALMSGMMIKVALYGLIRVLFQWLGATPVWLSVLLLALGVLSSVGGVVYALFQHELKRLLAFHSIENVGIIVLGLGASLMFQARGQTTWAALAFAAALLHVLNHAMFKGLLFLGAGSISRAAHSLDLDHLGGLLKRMPWTGGAFLVGSMAIAGLPPFNGFASEWLTLQALMHIATGAAGPGADAAPLGAFGVGSAVAGFLATVGLAMTAALAVLCFSKVVGLVLLGPPRTHACATAQEVPRTMIAGTTTLAVFCVALGLLPGLLIPRLMVLAPGAETLSALDAGSAFRLQVPFPGSGGLPTLAVGVLLALLVVVFFAVRGNRRAATAPVWACGQRIEPALHWTSSGFTKSLRLTLETALRAERQIEVDEQGGVLQTVTYHGNVPHLFDTVLYAPVVRRALEFAAFARRLQSGSLRTYVLYLLALVLVMLAVARIWTSA